MTKLDTAFATIAKHWIETHREEAMKFLAESYVTEHLDDIPIHPPTTSKAFVMDAEFAFDQALVRARS